MRFLQGTTTTNVTLTHIVYGLTGANIATRIYINAVRGCKRDQHRLNDQKHKNTVHHNNIKGSYTLT